MSAARLCRSLVLAAATISAAGCADVSTEGVSLCYSDAYAAPGKQAELIFHTRRSLSGHISKVTVAGGDLFPVGTSLFDAEQAGFGMFLETPVRVGVMRMLQNLFVGDPDHPQTKAAIPIPADFVRRGAIPIELKVRYVRAKSSGQGEFETEATEAVLPATITIVEPGWEWLIRARDVGGRFLLAMILVAVPAWISDKKRDGAKVPDVVVWFLAAASAYAGFRYASEPLAASLGIVQSGWRALIFVGTFCAAAAAGDLVVKLLTKLRVPKAAAPAGGEAAR